MAFHSSRSTAAEGMRDMQTNFTIAWSSALWISRWLQGPKKPSEARDEARMMVDSEVVLMVDVVWASGPGVSEWPAVSAATNAPGAIFTLAADAKRLSSMLSFKQLLQCARPRAFVRGLQILSQPGPAQWYLRRLPGTLLSSIVNLFRMFNLGLPARCADSSSSSSVLLEPFSTSVSSKELFSGSDSSF